MPPTVDVIMLTWNRLDYTRGAIESYKTYVKVPYRLICVDNGSTDGTVEYLRTVADLVIANSQNVGAVRARNLGLAVSDADYLLFTDNDLVFVTDIVERLVACAERDNRIGIVGPLLHQHLTDLGFTADAPLPTITKLMETQCAGHTQDTQYTPGCWLVRRSLIDAVGGYDTAYDPYGFEEFDYAERAKAKGFRVVIALDCYVHHYTSVSTDQLTERDNVVTRSRQVFLNRWGVPISDNIGIVEPFTIPAEQAGLTNPDAPPPLVEYLKQLHPRFLPRDPGMTETGLPREIDQLVASIPDPGKDVLVIGPGSGHVVRYLRHLYGKTALGLVPTLQGESVYGIQEGEPHAIPFPDAAFDGVLAWRSLERSAVPLVALLEISRVLRPGGRAIVIVPPAEPGWVWRAGHYSVLSDAHWRRLFADAGLSLLQTTTERLIDAQAICYTLRKVAIPGIVPNPNVADAEPVPSSTATDKAHV